MNLFPPTGVLVLRESTPLFPDLRDRHQAAGVVREAVDVALGPTLLCGEWSA
jgi:hypothetical protein